MFSTEQSMQDVPFGELEVFHVMKAGENED